MQNIANWVQQLLRLFREQVDYLTSVTQSVEYYYVRVRAPVLLRTGDGIPVPWYPKKIRARRACAHTRYVHLRNTTYVVLEPLEAPYVPSRFTISPNRGMVRNDGLGGG